MAERHGGVRSGGGGSSRRRLRRDSDDPGNPSSSAKDKRTKRTTKPTKERWLLTRKTWRYMADAGRKLVPDGVHNRPEDIPKIEQYFQEVCQKEPKFLLWRKASYPGSLGFRTHRRRRPAKGGSCRVKASSADEADDSKSSSSKSSTFQATSGGRFDISKMKRDWLAAAGGSNPATPVSQRRVPASTCKDSADDAALADMLQRYLNVVQRSDESVNLASGYQPRRAQPTTDRARTAEPFDYQSLIDKLQQHLNLMFAEDDPLSHYNSATRPTVPPRTSHIYQGDYVHKTLMDTLSRYYGKSPNREHVVSDILTDRKVLERLYFELRRTRGFRGPRATGVYSSPTPLWTSSRGPRSRIISDNTEDDRVQQRPPVRRELTSLPPLIAVQGPSTDRSLVDESTQTDPVPRQLLQAILLARVKEDVTREAKEAHRSTASGRRRSSVDNDDVSPSVSDTIKRYLRMARKKSIDAEKVDRFKRVNYDRNLRFIGVKSADNAEARLGEDNGNDKGSQTEENWVANYREMADGGYENLSDADTASPGSRNASSRSSIDAGLGSAEEPPTTPKHHQSFLSHFLHGHTANKDKAHSAPGSPALTSSNSAGGSTMQKSKSSSSVVHHGSRLVAKKIWRPRSKSTSRATNQPAVWTPQGKCTWAGTGGRRVTLQDTPLRALSEVERKVLCKVAVAKLQALNLGVHIRPPSETLGGSIASKPKRRAHLLKRKALTTGFFENKGKDDKNKESAAGGLVFGIPLSQCLENDRLARIAAGEIGDVGSLTQSSRHGSRTSFTSLIETTSAAAKTEEGGSCESLSSKLGSGPTGSDSGILDLSDGPPGECDTVPSIVQQCIKHLEAIGLYTLGVFRVSPSKKRVRQLREDFDCGRETKIGPEQCPHDVAALLKEYFRDLPDPLLCRDLYQAFVHTQKIRNRKLQQEALQHLIQLLPTPNRETLWALLNFLNEIVAHSEDTKSETGEWISGNKMDATNLATVFAPNILHCVKHSQGRTEVSAERAEERIDVINVVRALLEHANVLFTVPAALLDELYLHMMDTHPVDLDLALSRRAEEQCIVGDEIDPCSETETFSVSEEASSTTKTTTTTATSMPKATTGRKVWTREQCLHQTAGIGGDIGPRPRRSKRPSGRRREEGRSNSVDSGSSEDPADPRRKSSPMVITASLTIPMTGPFTLNLDDPDIPYIEETPKQTAPPRKHRQRSISGSEGEKVQGNATTLRGMLKTRGPLSGGGRHGSDSAVGSSATLSGDQPPSSPPSWASSPPASPDSTVGTEQHAPLQRTSFSAATRSVAGALQDAPTIAPYTPSITSIGGAVLKSKTADIERMLHISKSETQQREGSRSVTSGTSSDNKKYTKRRYTDSRHQTRHILDAETLAGKTTSTLPAMTPATAGQNQRGVTPPVWKRRELISSAPKEQESLF